MNRDGRLFGLTVAVVVLATGCTGGPKLPEYGSSDGREIAQLVEELNEARDDLRQLQKMFSGPAPANWKKFNEFLFDLEGSPSIFGDKATARVKIRSDGSGSEKGVKEWTFVREGSNWKIKSAALP